MNEFIEMKDLRITLTDEAQRRIVENAVLKSSPTQVYYLIRKYMLRRLGVQEGWYANSKRTKWVEEDGYGHYEREEIRGDITPEQLEVLEYLDTLRKLMEQGKRDV